MTKVESRARSKAPKSHVATPRTKNSTTVQRQPQNGHKHKNNHFTMAANTDDPFNDLFSLEDSFYDEGFRQGHADGERAGKIEGRTLGLENGFKKFVEAGRLQGKAAVWSHLALDQTSSRGTGAANTRLIKNLRMFYALVEPGTLPTTNTDEAVNDVDDRVKRAQAKARVLEKIVGELAGTSVPAAPAATTETPEASS